MHSTLTLYLMLGYPGAGKTTAAKAIHILTGAVHLWADQERRKRFKQPTHSHRENIELYAVLNEHTEQLLGDGKSVIFDTNFNFYRDREKLRKIANKYGAKATLIWVQTPREIAHNRATKLGEKHDTRILGTMPSEAFERMADNLEPPRSDEHPIALDGTKISPEYVKKALEL